MADKQGSTRRKQPKDTKSLPLSSDKPDDGVLTLEKLEEYFDSATKAAENPEPNYTLLPDAVVDEYLRMGVIPQFVMISSTSLRKIKAYIKAHPEADTSVNDLASNSPDTANPPGTNPINTEVSNE